VKAIETVTEGMPAVDAGQTPDAASPAKTAAQRPNAAELTTWLLEGRFFTVGPTGNVTSWSPRAADAFGWGRKEIIGTPLDETLAPGARLGGYSGGIEAKDSSGRDVPAEFAFVPIDLGVGYEFNSLLQDISTRSTDATSLAGFAKSNRETTYALIDSAWSGRQTEPAGWLVIFRAGEAAASAPVAAVAAAEPVADNVVSIADAAGSEEARAQLERARRDADEARVEIRSLEGQLEEARREAQRARQEVDVARQEAGDSRDALIVAQRGVEEAKRQLEDARRQTDEVRAASEEARIRSEEAQRDADSLRDQLREARDNGRTIAGRNDGELARAKEHEAELERSLADARAETARHQAEVAPLRERYQQAQRDLGALRADLESARAAAAELEMLSERRAAELERARTELDARGTELAALRGDAERARKELESQLADAAERLEARSSEAAELRSGLERAESEAADLRGALDAAQAESASMAALGESAVVSSPGADAELAAVRQRLERMRLAFDRAPVATALIAPDGRYMEVSDTLCETLGHSRDRLLSSDPPAIVHPDDVDAHRDLARRILAGEQAGARCLRRYVHADGHPLAMRESVTLVRDAEGRPSMFVMQVEEAHELSEQVVVDAEVEADEPPAERTGTALSTDAMRRALEDDLFELYCQPVLDLRTNTVCQHELLIRMRGEDGRLILPEAFLGPARRAGLAHAIDRWVVRQAIHLLGRVDSEMSLEVNLSPEAVHDPDLAQMVENELATSPVDPGRLVLEVTGATAADHLEATRELAKRLRGLGCRFALDDFRSNFGSFRLLRDLPLDYLKLDGELVSSLTESRTSQLIVKALVDVATGTGMKTIAVFVSDDETIQLLRQLGVGYAQGYAVGRPRPVADALAADALELPPG
jgi:PAS domain S-box-containing protein